MLATAQVPIDPVACYSFNGNANDGSGHGHNGTVFGAVLTTDRAGTPNTAYAFNGVDSYIEVPAFETFGISDEVSVGMWVQADAINGNFAVSVWPDDFNDRFTAAPHYGSNGNGSIYWDFGAAPLGGRQSIDPFPFSMQWTYFAFSASAASNRMRIYLNGTLINEVAHHSSIVNVAGRTLNLGGGNVLGYSHWDGKLDDIVLFDRELSSAEVLALYTSGASCAQDVSVAETAQPGPTLRVDPATNMLLIDAVEVATLEVVDATGRTLAQARLNPGRNTWCTAGMHAGVYIARVSMNGHSYATRVLLP